MACSFNINPFSFMVKKNENVNTLIEKCKCKTDFLNIYVSNLVQCSQYVGYTHKPTFSGTEVLKIQILHYVGQYKYLDMNTRKNFQNKILSVSDLKNKKIENLTYI